MDLNEYYQHVKEQGLLRTDRHARRWSNGILGTLGTVLKRQSKRTLSQALPDELARSLGDVFWLLHFPNSQMTREEFQQRAARRSGNSDPDFAYHPMRAVFGGLKQLLNDETRRQIGDELPPELQAVWQEA